MKIEVLDSPTPPRQITARQLVRERERERLSPAEEFIFVLPYYTFFHLSMIGIACKHAWDLVYSGQMDGRRSFNMPYTAMPVSLKMKQTIL
jgi:hypothetical protein